jgi:hypothetical protein
MVMGRNRTWDVHMSQIPSCCSLAGVFQPQAVLVLAILSVW